MPAAAAPKSHLFAAYKPAFPKVTWPPLEEVPIVERGSSADIRKSALLSAADKITHLSSAIGTEVSGIDLRELSNEQKDELALLVAQRGVVFFKNQDLNIHEQLDLGRYFGPLHKHANAAVPVRPGLEEVNVVYRDGSTDKEGYTSLFTKQDLWHSDVSYERQPPGITSLKLLTGPQFGGDTVWNSSYALYSSLSPGMQVYLEGLKALHVDSSNRTPRRAPVETVHPVVRVHPVKGWKSIFVCPAFTTRIIGIPKAESDAILEFLFSQIATNPEFQVRFRWEPSSKSVAIWDNRVVTHTATLDYWPATRHGLRVTPHAEKPLSVQEYEERTGKKAVDRLRDREHWGLDTKAPAYL
ncbi:putative alpha-ketoglutarate-dependent sulfonate dioxygenase [Hypsizygus marmoreus]|uniref:Alpha-ketoglutarate-dependent sulfonate dioxygenase n=1 Tax=Hypsizygus marmoreus TaxID=39966 RepID=A0A369JHQ1_HYPMA|nr:putative alpha-ketoglutarate-dependent sulfonate dioxygenase [Hypsizygus marmoreus]